MLHRNICPESVVISSKGAWKLAGFEFAVQGTTCPNGQVRRFKNDNATLTYTTRSLYSIMG